MVIWPFKDPDEIVDYGITWGDVVEGDTIVDSDWTVPAGLTNESESFSASTTTIWLSGGEEGALYSLVNHIVTEGGREWEETAELRVKSR